MRKFQSIKWLTGKGADLNAKEHPSFLLAVRYCNEEVIRFLVSHGAKIDVTNNVGSEAFLEAYYGKRFDNLSIIQELGHTAAKYGGQLLRQLRQTPQGFSQRDSTRRPSISRRLPYMHSEYKVPNGKLVAD